MIPFEPTGEARKAAAGIWNHYRALVDVGFTDQQATQILTTQMAVYGLMNRAR